MHKALVYDTQSLYQYLYTNTKNLSLQINNMSWDFDQLFPKLERNSELITREYTRVKFLGSKDTLLITSHKKIIFKITCTFYNTFIATNTIFVRR